MTTDVNVMLTLPENEAYALAELCKRIGLDDARRLSASEGEAKQMLMACGRIREALACESICVR